MLPQNIWSELYLLRKKNQELQEENEKMKERIIKLTEQLEELHYGFSGDQKEKDLNFLEKQEKSKRMRLVNSWLSLGRRD
jgi:cell division protein FtsB